MEEPDGFIKEIEIVHEDSTRELVRVKRMGLRTNP
jgi:hypothetical protein